MDALDHATVADLGIDTSDQSWLTGPAIVSPARTSAGPMIRTHVPRRESDKLGVQDDRIVQLLGYRRFAPLSDQRHHPPEPPETPPRTPRGSGISLIGIQAWPPADTIANLAQPAATRLLMHENPGASSPPATPAAAAALHTARRPKQQRSGAGSATLEQRLFVAADLRFDPIVSSRAANDRADVCLRLW
jgi:hypothetical protein